MNTTHKTLLLALTLLAGIAIISGCGKTNNSIVGQWSLNTQEAIARTTITTLFDSMHYYALGTTFTLNSDQSYELVEPGTTPETGTWVQNGSALTLTKSGGQVIFFYNVMAVSTHAMTIRRFDTLPGTNPQIIVERFYNHSR